MSQRAIFINGLVVLCVLLFVVRMWLINAPETANTNSNANSVQSELLPTGAKIIQIQANQAGWHAVGKGPMSIVASGTIDLGGLKTAPNDAKKQGDEKALVPRLPYGTLVGKIGESGEPFKVGITAKIAMKDTIYLTINDDNYTDNSGFYTVTIDSREASVQK